MMVDPIFTREREAIDEKYANFDLLPDKQQREILAQVRRSLAHKDAQKRRQLEREAAAAQTADSSVKPATTDMATTGAAAAKHPKHYKPKLSRWQRFISLFH